MVKEINFIYKTGVIMKIIKRIISSLKKNGFKKFILTQFSKVGLVKLPEKEKNLVKDSYELHSKLLDKVYGEGLDLAVGQISDGILKAIKTEFCNDSCFYDSKEIINSQSIHPVLKVDDHSEDTREALNENIIPGNMHIYNSKNPTLKLLHDELRQMFKIHIGSPFIFVNTRIWKTKPNSKKFGPNDWHTDGFFPGHRKIMIYLTPLNDDYGAFEWKDSKENIHRLSDQTPGKVVFFHNSKIKHQGVPGQTYERIAVEVTLMRSLVNGEQEWQGHFFGRHFKNLRQLEDVFNNDKLTKI